MTARPSLLPAAPSVPLSAAMRDGDEHVGQRTKSGFTKPNPDRKLVTRDTSVGVLMRAVVRAAGLRCGRGQASKPAGLYFA